MMMNHSFMPGKVSVVVPAYNVDAYIEECLTSLCMQTYENIEVIVVNDGSTDGTFEKALSVVGDDERFTVLTISNSGVSCARNIALDAVTGEYVVFVDADDVVAPDFISTLVSLIKGYGADCSVVGITPFVTTAPRFSGGHVTVYEKPDAQSVMLEGPKGFLCNKCFLTAIIEEDNIRLREDIFQSEDMLFLLEYLSKCSRVVFDDGCRYAYRQSVNSATNSLTNIQWFSVLDVFDAYRQRFSTDVDVLPKVQKSFLPMAYEAAYRYKYLKMSDAVLESRIQSMMGWCEQCLLDCDIKMKLKAWIQKYLMGVVLRSRARRIM